MADAMLVRCTCGKVYDATSTLSCPECGAPSRAAQLVDVAAPRTEPQSRSSSADQKILAQLEEQNAVLKRLLFTSWLTGVMILATMLFLGVKVR